MSGKDHKLVASLVAATLALSLATGWLVRRLDFKTYDPDETRTSFLAGKLECPKGYAFKEWKIAKGETEIFCNRGSDKTGPIVHFRNDSQGKSVVVYAGTYDRGRHVGNYKRWEETGKIIESGSYVSNLWGTEETPAYEFINE